ncbi:MAG: hypothetical protein QXE84_01495 [Candidatus Nitrosotenuis sp.]|uniref:Uncharacterized protein n=1 Tax=Candidatus Nitrosotenuis uzonensis TaxID=1407055 RepID=A0A812F4K2_9ARCH|nr:hypothetical protein [Candidatus Nitrosotenuis uzonensis]CAE6504921.1 conserved exported hypothetical protein [Candidatus Nitrosotenuis uzonensis]
MNKRGIIVSVVGLLMIIGSFAIAASLLGSDGFDGEMSIPSLLEGMFDQVTDNTQLQPGESMSFEFDASQDTKNILWGMQITDYQSGDKVQVSITNIYGDKFGTFQSDQPAFFETLKITQSESLNFNVENKGSRTITFVMMFTKNPGENERFSDPDSPLNKTLVPLAAIGILLILGIIVVCAGVIITVFDYKKRQNSEYV